MFHKIKSILVAASLNSQYVKHETLIQIMEEIEAGEKAQMEAVAANPFAVESLSAHPSPEISESEAPAPPPEKPKK